MDAGKMNSTDYKLQFKIESDGAGANRVKADLNGIERVLNKIGGRAIGPGVFGGTLAAHAVTELTGLVSEGGRALLNYSARMEQTRIGFETLMGGAAAANKHLKELQEFAKTTPFEFESLVGASRRLQNVGLEAGRVVDVLRDIGNAASAAGATTAEIDRITVAFSQVLAKGKLSAEEVNQFAEAGIPIWKMMSEQLGKSKAEIMKLSEQGKISSDIFLQAFQEFSQANYGDAMERQSRTFLGALSNIKDAALITSETAFAPLFGRISGLANELARETEGQPFEELGNIIAAKISKGFGEAMHTLALQMGTELGNSLRGAGKKNLLDALEEGFDQGFWRPILGDTFAKAYGIDVSKAANLSRGIAGGRFRESAGGSSSLKNQLGLAETDKSAKTLQKTIDDLISKILFFGDSSQVAATKQALLNDGIYRFDQGLAKTAVSLAAQLDKLTANQKAQEEYNANLKTAREELSQIQDNARFEIDFPEATELQRFDRWVKSQKTNFIELASAIASARGTLEHKAFMDAVRSTNEAIQDQTRFLTDRAEDYTPGVINPVGDAAARMAEALGSKNLDPRGFAKKVQGYVDSYRILRDEFGEGQQTAQVMKAFRTFLLGLDFTSEAGPFAPFGDQAGGNTDRVIQGFIKLGDAVADPALKAGLQSLDDLLSSLGLRLGNDYIGKDLDTITKQLSDPEITAAIRARAKALGMTTAEMKKIIIDQATGALQTTGPFYANLNAGKVNQIKTQGDALKDMSDQWLRDLPLDMLDRFADGIGGIVENLVLMGTAGPDAMRKLTASILANVAAQSAVLAIKHLAFGFAALTPWGALEYGPAVNQFKAAALLGSIAVGSGLAGRAIAGDAFNQSSSSSSLTGSTAAANQSPYTRTSDTAFYSGRDSSNDRLAAAIEEFNATVKAVPPGHVFVAGMKANRGVIGRQALADIRSGAVRGKDFATSMGMR